MKKKELMVSIFAIGSLIMDGSGLVFSIRGAGTVIEKTTKSLLIT